MMGQSLIDIARTIECVTNIGELFAALAVDWQEGSPDNRRLMGGYGGNFIRVEPRRNLHPHYRQWPGDIPVEPYGYLMGGFIRVDIPKHFHELFTTSADAELPVFSAELTARGVELAHAGLLDVQGLEHSFYHPPVVDISNEPVLGMIMRIPR